MLLGSTARPRRSTASRRLIRPCAPASVAILRSGACLGVTDAVAIALALAVALTVSGRAGVAHRLLWGFASVPLMIALFKAYGLYDRDGKRIAHSTVDDIPWLFHAVIAGTLLLWLYSQVHAPEPTRPDRSFAVRHPHDVLCLPRPIRRPDDRCGWLEPERALLVGGGTMGAVLATKLAAHPEYRSIVVGVLSHGGDREPTLG